MLDQLAVGDEIVTAGGMYGEVREVRDDEVLVRIAPDLDVRIARRAVAGIVPREEPDDAAELGPAEAPEESGPTPGT
jgi:preprotein translocase subunit YajC